MMLDLKNNFIMSPVKTGYSDGTGIITKKHMQFYQDRSKYLGAITLEPLYMDAGLRELPTQIGIDADDKIVGLKKLTDSIHQFDTKVIAHLNHPGRMANPKIPGNYYWSASPQQCEAGGPMPKQMNETEIQSVVKLFADAAMRAEQAGFDIVELQFGHGYLMAQFISPKVNTRTDKYGGSFDNRIRFSLEVLDAVKKATKLPVIIRLSGDEMIPDGIKLEEMIAFSKILKEKAVAAIHVSAGTLCNTPPWYFQHMFVPKGKTWEFAKKIKEVVGIQTIYVGQINTEEDIESLNTNYKADYIALGRALVADADFVGKVTHQLDEIARPCLACSEGCLGGVRSGKGLECLVNPKVGKDFDVWTKADNVKKVAVVGGGLAGMEAAFSLNKKGHKVTLFEKEKLGGQFNLAYLPPHKDSLKKIIDYYTNILQDKVEIIYEEATANRLNNFDEVVFATGSKPSIPLILGLTNYYWAEILEKQNLPTHKKVLVIGGGLIGTEVAHKLLDANNEVVLVEMLGEIARGMEMIEQKLTLKSFKAKDIRVLVDTKVQKIEDKKVYLEGKDFKETLTDIDIVVVATGMKAYNPLQDILQNSVPVHSIGDAHKVGKAQTAIKDAYEMAKMI